MLPIFILFFLFTVLLSSLTTIPFAIALLVVCSVIFRKSRVFFAAFLLGLFLDLFLLRPLGQTGLMFILFMFVIGLYERKFEAKTGTFVFISAFLGSFIYLKFFGGSYLLLQTLISSLFAILLFKFSIHKNYD